MLGLAGFLEPRQSDSKKSCGFSISRDLRGLGFSDEHIDAFFTDAATP